MIQTKAVVLIVDEERQLQKLYRLVLERNGYRVLIARSSQDALAISRTYPGRIDLLLSELEIEGMTGLELAHQIVPERQGISVLIASDNLAYASECEFPFLAKPFSLDGLLTAIAAAIIPPISIDDVLRQHIPAEDLENYARNVLPPQEREWGEQHLLICGDCLKALEATEAYVSSMRAATSQFVSLSGRRKFQQQRALHAAPR